jgi:hypothetical protein
MLKRTIFATAAAGALILNLAQPGLAETVTTRIGTLEFENGLPTAETQPGFKLPRLKTLRLNFQAT